LRALRRENLGFYRAIDDKTGELVRPIVSPVVVFENIDGEHGMAIGAALQRLQGDDLSGAAKGSGMHCGVAMGANCGDTYKVMYSHDTEGVESDRGVETYFKALLDSAKRAACERVWPGDDAVSRSLFAEERSHDLEAKLHRYAGPGPRGGGDAYMHPHLDAYGAGWVLLVSMGATAKFVFCNGVLKESASFDGCLVPVSVGEADRANWPCCRLPWSANLGGGGYDKNVYNYRGAWTHEQQCQGRWRPGEEEAPECPHCRQIEMKSGDAILFHGGPEHGNLHGVAGVKDEPPPEDLRARCEAVARRFPKPGAVVAETRAPTVLGRGGGKKTVLQQRTEKLSLYPEWLRDPKSTRPFRYSLQIREQRQRRGCVAQKLAPEAQREAPGPSLRDRLRGLVAGPFEGEGRALV